MARPSMYNFKMCKDICDSVADGLNIKNVLNSNSKYPTFQTWCNWKREHTELFDLYINAIQDKAESVDSKLDELEEMLLDKKIDASTYNTLAQTLKWKAAKYYPKMFGDQSKLTLEGGEKPITISFED